MAESRRHRQVDHVIEPLVQSLFPCRAHDPWGRLRGRYRFALGQAREETLASKIDPFKIDLPIYQHGHRDGANAHLRRFLGRYPAIRIRYHRCAHAAS